MKEFVYIGKFGENRFYLKCPYNIEMINKLKRVPGFSWDGDLKVNSFKLSQEVLREIIQITSFYEIRFDNVILDFYCPFQDLKKELIARNYSRKTVVNYLYYNKEFLYYTGKIPQLMVNFDIKNYVNHMNNQLNYSASTMNCAINAIKFYYGQILQKEFIYQIVRPKMNKRLPVILSKDEVFSIIHSLNNIKHRLILMFAYSSGLRVSEISNLALGDIDIVRKLIHIRNAKGQKDRYTIISEKLMIELDAYKKEYKPSFWVFESYTGIKHLTIRTMQKVFEKACKAANIQKKVSIHSLRHSFATHLLEDGIDIRYIQELLGHSNIKTTEIYTHVATSDIKYIRSPLDRI